MTMNRMVRLALLSTYLCAVSGAQPWGLERASADRKASTWNTRLYELISSRHPQMRNATSSVELFLRGWPLWQR